MRNEYLLVITNRFRKSFKELEKSVQDRIFNVVSELVKRPYMGVKLSGELSGLWKLRVGNYRVIYFIDEKNRRVVLLNVGHRREIYQ